MPLPPTDLSGPRGVPLLGSFPAFARDPLGFCSGLVRDYGDISTFVILNERLVLLFDPAMIEVILLGKHRCVQKDAIYELLRQPLGNGLVTAEREVWRRHRKLVAPSFSRHHIQRYAQTMLDAAEQLGGTLAGDRDVHADMMAVSQRIVLETLFGTDLGVDVSQVGRDIDIMMDSFLAEAQGLLRLVPSAIPTPKRWRTQAAVKRLDALLWKIIAARRAAGLGDDLLSRLIAARDDEGQGLDDVELRDEAVTLFVAGHETTALALTYALLLIGAHPAVQERIEAEVDAAVLEGAGAMAALPYTSAVVKESMRILPPVWTIGREVIEDVTVGEHTIARGTQVLICQWVRHRDPRHFDEPERFRPERWLDGLEGRLPRMAYLPFGGGPRICVGNHFAMMEIVLVLAMLIRHRRFEPLGPVPPKLVPTITLRPAGPVRMRVTPR